ncbi:MAG TPA: PDZ domain-containing protein [Thermoanaerobaculia bacterium]|nr:PDZ domain-containing protein [Thermoanaerobaculia bacterium]
MRSRFILFSAVVVSLAAAAFAGDDAKKCNTPPDECARQIRQMLAGRPYLGVLLLELTPGLIVKSVVPDSPAEHADLKAGDKLVAVNGHRTTEASIKDFKQILDEVGRTHRHLWMLVQRRGAFKKIDVMMEPYSKVQIERIVTQHLSEAHSVASAPPDSRP